VPLFHEKGLRMRGPGGSRDQDQARFLFELLENFKVGKPRPAYFSRRRESGSVTNQPLPDAPILQNELALVGARKLRLQKARRLER
jgi:hypothetical protein